MGGDAMVVTMPNPIKCDQGPGSKWTRQHTCLWLALCCTALTAACPTGGMSAHCLAEPPHAKEACVEWETNLKPLHGSQTPHDLPLQLLVVNCVA